MRACARFARRGSAFLTAALVLAAAWLPAGAGGDVSLFYGRRALPEEAWHPVDRPPVYGFAVGFGREEWPLGLEAAYLISVRRKDASFPIYGDGDIAALVEELSFGVRKSFRAADSLDLHLGGGVVSFIESVDVDAEGPGGMQHDTDTSQGAYARAGASWRLGPRFSAGLDVRGVFFTSFHLEDHFSDPKRYFDADADYVQATLLATWRWPGR